MDNPSMTNSAYCDRVHKKIELDANELPTGCRHFVVRNGKPICKKVIGFPLPTPGSIAKMMFRTIFEPIVVFTSISVGHAILPSWWCKLCAHGAKPSKTLEVTGKAVGLIAGEIDHLSTDHAKNMTDGIRDMVKNIGKHVDKKVGPK